MKILSMEDNCMIPDGKWVTVEFDDGTTEGFTMYPDETIEKFIERIRRD